MHEPGSPNPQRHGPAATRPQTLTVLGIALALRLLVLGSVLAQYPPGWFFTRGIEMGLLASSLLAGKGLSSPFGGSTGPTAFVAPGYPLVVAGVFRLLGPYSRASEIFLIVAQILVNLLTVWLILHLARTLARNLSDPRAAPMASWIAGLFWACSPAVLWMPTIFWDTSLAACMVTGLVALAVHHRNGLTPQRALGLGAAAALAALINPALVLVLTAVIAWMILSTRAPISAELHRLGLAALAFVVVFSPWPIRNARDFHAFIPLRTTVGFELWMGNRDGATGFLEESLFPMFNAQELADYNARGELAYTAHKSQLAQTFIRRHPAEFLRLTGLRIVRFWTGTGSKGGSAVFAVHACLTSLFGLAGLWALFQRTGIRRTLPLALPLLLFPLPYYITHAEFRYRLVLDPLLTALAGYALATWSERPAAKTSLGVRRNSISRLDA